MQSPDFGQCAILALAAARKRKGVRVGYGLFTPDTERNCWDERWALQEHTTFTHFWLVEENGITDVAAKQFGYDQQIQTSANDARYVLVGYMDTKTRVLKRINADIDIVWDSYDEKELPPKVKVIFYYED